MARQSPRDREGTFEPQAVKKHKTDIYSIEDQVLSLNTKGMAVRNISEHLDIHPICIPKKLR